MSQAPHFSIGPQVTASDSIMLPARSIPTTINRKTTVFGSQRARSFAPETNTANRVAPGATRSTKDRSSRCARNDVTSNVQPTFPMPTTIPSRPDGAIDTAPL